MTDGGEEVASGDPRREIVGRSDVLFRLNPGHSSALMEFLDEMEAVGDLSAEASGIVNQLRAEGKTEDGDVEISVDQYRVILESKDELVSWLGAVMFGLVKAELGTSMTVKLNLHLLKRNVDRSEGATIGGLAWLNRLPLMLNQVSFMEELGAEMESRRSLAEARVEEYERRERKPEEEDAGERKKINAERFLVNSFDDAVEFARDIPELVKEAVAYVRENRGEINRQLGAGEKDVVAEEFPFIDAYGANNEGAED